VQNWMARRGNLPEETRNYVRNITGHPAERWARVNAKTEETALPGHARCPGMPEIAVSIPEAAPVKVAKKGKSKVAAKKTTPDAKADKKPDTKTADAKSDAKTDAKTDTKTADAKSAPAATSAKPYTLASMTGGKKAAVIKDGKLKIMAPEKGAKPSAGKKAAAGKAKPVAKPATKTAAKSEPKAKSKSEAKSAAKPATKTAAKPAATKSGGKGVKVAAAR